MRVAVDTNVLLYAEGLNEPLRRIQANHVIATLRVYGLVMSAQVVGEFYRALVSKAKMRPMTARRKLLDWMELLDVAPTSEKMLLSAFDLSVDHQVHIFDAIVLACASEERCRLLISEDLQDGFTWGGVTVVNPFAATLHPLLEAAMRPRI